MAVNNCMETFVLGNGKSRLGIDLHKLQTKGTVYGCNALYRDFAPDVLISTDPGISNEIQDSGYQDTHIHYTRRPNEGSNSKEIESKIRGWSSGPICCWYGSVLNNAEHVYLLGFDLSSLDKKINNVYAGTDNYKDSNAKVTYYGNWIKQLQRVMQEFPGKMYTRVITDYTITPKEWNELPNYKDMHITDFSNWLNNT